MPDPDPKSVPKSSDKPRGVAEAMAADALRAAQQAVSNIKQGVAGAPAEAGADPLRAAQAAVAQAKTKGGSPVPAAAGAAASPLDMPNLEDAGPPAPPEGMDLLADVNLNVKIELGRTRMLVEDVLRLGEGSVVELDKLAGDPVDVYVNDRPVARGEVLVLNDNFCIRINEIISQAGLEGA